MWNAGRMDLREAGIGEERALFVGAIRGGDVATARVGREVKDVAVAASREHNGVGRVLVDLSRDQVARDDSLGVTIYNHQVEHLGLRKHLHGASGDLAAERLITAAKQLLTSLAARVKRSAIIWTNEPRVVLVTIPLSGERPGRDLWVKRSNHNCCAGLTSPSKTAMGIEV